MASETVAGEIVGELLPTSVTVVLAYTPVLASAAVMVTLAEDGIVAGAVYSPAVVIEPTVACQFVAPE